MPSFLNKVFGYKRHDDKDRPSRDVPDTVTLLDGIYEEIPPASTFVDPLPTKDRESPFSLFRPKPRGFSLKPSQRHPPVVPHLTLRLPARKGDLDSPALGVVFEADLDSQVVLDDAVIAAKRLSPPELLVLIRACSQAISERGLETLGIMHPHWFSASPDVQRKLISLFIRSLTPQTQTPTLSSTPNSPPPAFESELQCTRSPHDVAAVLRWGLRHLSLEDAHFGKDGAEWAWYSAFFNAERNASFPPKAFSELLLPELPASHVELLTATLGLISSLASHAEINSISGSKLSKFLGIWLLVVPQAEESDDWDRFYARWERAGRILEHLFLARLREESLSLRLPTRLEELVKNYPYNNKGSSSTDDDLLSRPRFSTCHYDALCVRVESVLTIGADRPKQHPIQLLLDAFQLPIENPSGDEHTTLWNTLKTLVSEDATSSPPEGPQFARIFVDETIQLLSLIPAGSNAPSPTLLASPISKIISRKRSSSPLSKALDRAFSKSNADTGSSLVSPTLPSSPAIADWAQFSLSGFGETPTTQPLVAFLKRDEDAEVTHPRISFSHKFGRKSRSRRRRSEERESSGTPPSPRLDIESSIVETKLASVHVVQIDEAFIDFWSDAIVDPISADWPTFILCRLKEIPGAQQPVHWLLIEQTYSRQQPQLSRNPSPDGRRGRSPRPSFKSDISGFRINSMFSSARKRLSVFSKSVTDLDLRKSSGKILSTGELGEVLVEEEPTPAPTKTDQLGSVADGNAVTPGAIAENDDHMEANGIHTTTVVSISPTGPISTREEVSGSVFAAAKVPSVEPTLQSGDRYDSPSEPSRPKDSTLLSFVNPHVDNAVDSADPIVSASVPIAEKSDAQGGRFQAEPPRQDDVVDVPPVELVTPIVDRDGHLPVDLSNLIPVSGEVAETVPVSLAAESVSAAIAAVSVTIDEPTAEESSHVDKQESREAPANVATSAAEPVHPLPGNNIDDRALMPSITPETPTHVEPDSITSVIDGVGEEEHQKEVAELAEIPIPAPGRVAFIEETPDPVVSTGDATRAVTEPDVYPDMVIPQTATAELQVTLEAKEMSITYDPAEAPSVEIIHAVDTCAQDVSVDTEHAADEVSGLAAEEAQPYVRGPSVEPVEVVPEVEADNVFATTKDVTPADVRDQAALETSTFGNDIAETREDIGAPTPMLVNIALVNETPGPETATEERAAIEIPPPVAPESEAVENSKVNESAAHATTDDLVASTSEPVVPLTVENVESSIETEVPTQVLADPFSTVSITDGATAALATAVGDDETTKAEAEAPDHPTQVDDLDARGSAVAFVLENTLAVEEGSSTLEIAVEARQSERVEVEVVADTRTNGSELSGAVEGTAAISVEDGMACTGVLATDVGPDVDEPVVVAHNAEASIEDREDALSEPGPQSVEVAMHTAVDATDEAPHQTMAVAVDDNTGAPVEHRSIVQDAPNERQAPTVAAADGAAVTATVSVDVSISPPVSVVVAPVATEELFTVDVGVAVPEGEQGIIDQPLAIPPTRTVEVDADVAETQTQTQERVDDVLAEPTPVASPSATCTTEEPAAPSEEDAPA